MNTNRMASSFLASLVALPFAAAQVPAWQPVGSGAPSARYGHAMALEPATGALLVFGGHDGTQRLNDTWRYSAATQSWFQVTTPTAPSPRRWTSMVADTIRNRVVLFGGDTGPAAGNGETWAFTAGAWTMIASSGPPSRYSHSMAFNSATAAAVLFGGSHNGTDTWELFGTSWQQIATPHSPGARTYGAMAYDARTNHMILFGGANPSFTTLSDTWRYNGVDWTQVATSMPALYGASAAYDTSRERIVLFGGRSTANSNRTFEFFDNAWTERFPANPPTGRYGGAAAYLPGRGVHVFGGATFGSQLQDMQRYQIVNGATYTPAGAGCSTATLAPIGDAAPWVGSSFRRVVGAVGSQCTAHLITEVTSFGVADFNGNARFTMVIPNSAALAGIHFIDQALVIGVGNNPAHASLTAAMAGFTATK
jgi:hypothetical protein